MQRFWIGFFYASYFAFVGLYSPFLGPYLKSLGHSLDVIALSLGLMQVMRVFGPLAWGWAADATGQRVLLLRVAVSGGLLMAWVTFLNDQSATHLVLCLVFLNLSISGLVPMTDVFAMEASQGNTGVYGRMRLFGSLGFVLAVLGFGFWAEQLGYSAFQWWVYLTLGLALWASWQFKSQSAACIKPSASNKPVSGFKETLSLLKPADLQLFWWASFFMILAHGVFYAYFSLYLQEHQYTESVIGFLCKIARVLTRARLILTGVTPPE